MSVVAISETFGSQGNEIGWELSRSLGYEFADREIIAKAEERYGESVMELHHVSEEKPPLWERFSDSTRHYVSCIEATILEMAARDEAVLVGHGTAIVLREIPHVLRVRVGASESLRATRLSTSRASPPERRRSSSCARSIVSGRRGSSSSTT